MKKIVSVAAAILAVSMLSVTAFAAFTPSVEQKDAPTVVVPPNSEHKIDGKPAIVVKDETGKVVSADKVETLKITPVSSFKKKDTTAEETKPDSADETAATEETVATEPMTEEEIAVQESLEKTYTEILEAENLAVLVPELPDVMKELKVDTKVEDLVVQDLFNISLPEEMEKSLEIEGNTIDISFEMTIEEGKQLIVMVQTEDGEWVLISGDSIVVDEDGYVTDSFPCVGNVAFVIA